MVDLDDLFVVNEDTTYRDEYEFNTSLTCEPIYYKMCSDELCTSEHMSDYDIRLADVNSDGSVNQLSISTLQGFANENFYIQAYNNGLQHKMLFFNINICGAEVLSYSSQPTANFTLPSEDFG